MCVPAKFWVAGYPICSNNDCSSPSHPCAGVRYRARCFQSRPVQCVYSHLRQGNKWNAWTSYTSRSSSLSNQWCCSHVDTRLTGARWCFKCSVHNSSFHATVNQLAHVCLLPITDSLAFDQAFVNCWFILFQFQTGNHTWLSFLDLVTELSIVQSHH